MIIDRENENVRLDRFLKNNCKNNTLSEIFKAIRTGDVRLNGKKSKENYRLQVGDILEIKNLDFNLKKKEHNNYSKEMIFFEDENYLIINKPKGIPMHKGTNNKKGLAELFNIDFANRLDKKTSGLVIACKNKKSLRHITELIREGKVTKKYKAICKNNFKYKMGDTFTIDKDIEGKKSISIFKVANIEKEKIEFEVNLITGRKHQIRIHLASIDLPIIGDDKYGKYKKEDELMLECFCVEFDDYKFEIK